MWILPLVGYAGALVGFCFLTMAIASGLYYLSELVEEHTVLAKRLLTRTIYTIIGVQVTLWLIDGFPFWPTLLGIGTHLVYLGNMRRFPFVKLSDPLFLTSIGMLCYPDVTAFSFAGHPSLEQMLTLAPQCSYSSTTTSGSVTFPTPKPAPTISTPSFTMIASYFGLCVWLIPFALFVSLSAGDNVLPTIGTEPARGFDGKPKPQGMVKAVVDYVRSLIGELAGSEGLHRP
jgi:hypothetical protein